MSDNPAEEYRRRLEQRRQTVAALDRADARLSAARLTTFAAAAVLWAAGWAGIVSYWWLVLPGGVFIVLLVVHERIIHDRETTASAIIFYERGLARIEDRWHGTGESGERFRDDRHLYANDLDVFGPGSLFQLLSLARTGAGEETLANWLKQPALVDEIRERQDAVRELTSALDLREALSVAGASIRAGVDTESLISWAEGGRWLRPAWLRQAAMLATAFMVCAVVFSAMTHAAGPVAVALVVQLVFAGALARRTAKLLHAADNHGRDLDLLRQMLTRLEAERFTTARLAALRRQLDSHGTAASASIRSVRRLIDLNEWQRNAFFVPVAVVLLWGLHLAWAIDAWRRRHGDEVRRWLLAIGELEAFGSLAAYRYEHPADPFPELEPAAAAVFEGRDLGHPLVADARLVRNDVSFAPPTRLFVVSGSNMSGKSTLLRTVGVNAVLALAGAPVRASRLRLSSLSIGATLRIQDSLLEGRSRFYGEITRIRELTAATHGDRPLLFLLDELFHGTNSHDRLIGAAGVLSMLLERGAIGLVTTHDLALTAIAEQVGNASARGAPTRGAAAANVHFDDWFDGGEIRFDYLMKPGPVTRSNAIALMRAVGLNVGASTQEVDEPIMVVDDDHRWPDWYAADAEELSRALGTRLREVQHFGSTSVAGTAAKPIIDILVAPIDWPLAATDRRTLERLGYEYLGEANVPGREYFRRRTAHDTNLALVQWGSCLWYDNLLLRDYLRAHEDEAAEYARAKKELWQKGGRTLLTYSAGKTHIVTTLLNAAQIWRVA
jgi:GrpB-like predicted nucleotidyltransferase (UPF0157 family)